MKPFRKYWADFKITLLNSLTYPGELIGRSLLIVPFMWIFYQLWKDTFQAAGTHNINGMTLYNTMWYLMMAETIELSRPALARTISENVKDGSIAYILNKPYSFLLYQFSNSMGETIFRALTNALLEPTGDPARDAEQIWALYNKRTRAVVVSHVLASTGAVMPVREIAATARARGVWSVIDGAQAAGIVPLDLADLGADCYLMASGHKWLLGPVETGFLHVRPERLPELATRFAGAYAADASGWSLEESRLQFLDRASRYEYGTRSSAQVAGLAAAIEWQEAVGFNLVRRRATALATLAVLAIGTMAFILQALPVASRIYIDINSASQRKIPIAIPALRHEGGDAAGYPLATNLAESLGGALTFTGLFQVLNPKMFLQDPQQMGTDLAEIKFTEWSFLGADMLVRGSYRVSGGKLEVTFWLFDVVNQTRIMKKSYLDEATAVREIVLRFADDMMLQLTGEPGIFNTRIAFVGDGTGHKEIYVADFDGFNPRRLTSDSSINLNPEWSPDGKTLAYVSYKKGNPSQRENPNLYLMNLLTKSVQIHSQRPGLHISPAWHPQGGKLAVTLSVSGNSELYLIDTQGKILEQLTKRMGCTASALCGAFCAVQPDALRAAVAAMATMGVVGEMALSVARGPGTMAASFLDGLHQLDAAELDRRLRVEASG